MATIVIADDSPTLRRIVSSVLSKDGHEVIQAEDGVEAVQAVFAHQPDAIVMDVQMPRVSGYVATRLLKDDWQTADIPIILLTSLDQQSDKYWGRSAGADDYLTKDFEAPQLIEAVEGVMKKVEAARGGRPALKADPVELDDDDVLTKITELLDRKLFETSVAAAVTELAATTHRFEETVAGLLDVVSRFVDYHLAAVLLLQERVAYISVKEPASFDHYRSFLVSAAETVASSSGEDYTVQGLDARVADPEGHLDEDEEGEMGTFLSMPLRGHGGRVVGVLALSSSQKQAFSETAFTTLKLLDAPAAIVIDNARHSVTSA
ncbi:MAG TPA: response regulator [Mycobacteriales bacterium]|jgi:twitching motility two-component system response regulator PilH|nr:response regulator [Mycobacteriales bacterium]